MSCECMSLRGSRTGSEVFSSVSFQGAVGQYRLMLRLVTVDDITELSVMVTPFEARLEDVCTVAAGQPIIKTVSAIGKPFWC